MRRREEAQSGGKVFRPMVQRCSAQSKLLTVHWEEVSRGVNVTVFFYGCGCLQPQDNDWNFDDGEFGQLLQSTVLVFGGWAFIFDCIWNN